jgi:2-dehydro-3-deoxyphosphogluconate aldolase/(4S)-4-hydroxy-2-oxoglutarate aldolase
MSVTTTRADVVKRIELEGVVAVVRIPDAKLGREVANALIAGGVSAIEITMTVPRAVELIAELSAAVPQALIGAGTVTEAQTARDVIAAGARYVISPVFRPAVIEACLERDVAVMPGCFSPTEIFSAWEMGADAVKLFPATALGPSFIRDLRGPFPSLKIVPTGGVSLENAADWIRAGAMAIGVGSALIDPKAIQAGRFDIVTDTARAFAAAVRGAR